MSVSGIGSGGHAVQQVQRAAAPSQAQRDAQAARTAQAAASTGGEKTVVSQSSDVTSEVNVTRTVTYSDGSRTTTSGYGLPPASSHSVIA